MRRMSSHLHVCLREKEGENTIATFLDPDRNMFGLCQKETVGTALLKETLENSHVHQFHSEGKIPLELDLSRHKSAYCTRFSIDQIYKICVSNFYAD